MRVLITGGAGFIGSHLVDSLLKLGYEITILDSLSPQIHGDTPELKKTKLVKFIQGDIRNTDLLDELLTVCDIVIHLAAETGTAQSMYNIHHYYEVNLLATANLFELIALNHKHIRKVIFASSRSVYGEGAYLLGQEYYVPKSRNADQLSNGQWEPKGPNGEVLTLVATPENITTRPTSIYAATKLGCEQMASIVSEAYGINIMSLRFQNVYGEGQSLKNPYTGIISIFANRMRKDLPINIFEDGYETRDFIHVSDIVEAINMCLNSNINKSFIMNIGSGIPTTVFSVAEILKRKLESASAIHISGDFRVGDIRHCYADMSYANENLGFSAKVTMEEGLDRFCSWFATQAIEDDKSEIALKELSVLGLAK